MWLLAALVAVPIIEIALFIQVGGAIGLWPTLGFVVATAFVGAALLRNQGAGAMARLQRALAEGHDPALPLVHGALILVAGVLLLTPGFFTDAVGLALLVPPLRAALISTVGRHLVRNIVVMGSASAGWPRGEQRGDVVEGEFEEVRPSQDSTARDRRRLSEHDIQG